jgi:hypothetical protein
VKAAGTVTQAARTSSPVRRRASARRDLITSAEISSGVNARPDAGKVFA